MINILKKIREERGMTQEEVAKSSHIALRSYQYYEKGKRIPDVYTAIRIADALKIEDVRKLFGAAPPGIEKKPDGNPAK